MSTIATPLLQDKTYSSITVTQLFHGNSTFIRNGSVARLEASEAVFDNLTVSNFIVNGTTTSTAAQTDLGLSPSQLVATNVSSTPVSFPYGSNPGDIAIRDSDGAITFTQWTTAETAQPQLILGGAPVFFNSPTDATITIPDVGADANVVIYGSNNLKNLVSGDNILNLKSPDSAASIYLSGPNVATTTVSYEFGSGDQAKAKLVCETATQVLTIRDALDASRIRMTPGVANTLEVASALVPKITGASGMSNGNQNGFKGLFLVKASASINDFTSAIVLSNPGACILTLNLTEGDSIGPMSSKDATFTNSFITPTTRILVSVMGLNGTVNGVGVGVPYVAVTSVGTGTCTLRTYNISNTNTMSVFVIVAVVLLP